MKVSQKFTLLAGLLICILFSSCGFFAEAGKKVSEYCPGLNLGIDGISISFTEALKVTVIDYEQSYQGKVDTYFADKANGFAADNPRKYLYLKNGDERIVADGDSVLTKSVVKGKSEVDVIYDATTRKIIFTEPRY